MKHQFDVQVDSFELPPEPESSSTTTIIIIVVLLILIAIIVGKIIIIHRNEVNNRIILSCNVDYLCKEE